MDIKMMKILIRDNELIVNKKIDLLLYYILQNI